MDLNYLLHRQRVERFRAQSAACCEARRAHAALAALYGQAIDELNVRNRADVTKEYRPEGPLFGWHRPDPRLKHRMSQ